MVCSRYPKEYRYYDIALKRKCFRKLKNNVWEKKTRWILLEKADHHHQLRLLKKYFHLWIAYLNECLKEKINTRVAEAFHEEKLKWKGLSALKGNVEERRILMRICGRMYERSLKHKCWHQWKHYTQKRAKVREIKLLADNIRQERLRIRCFYLWSFRLREKRFLQNAYKNAEMRHEMKLKQKYFSSWKIFTEKRIRKMKIEKLAKICYEDKLKEKFIGCWKRYASQRRRYRYQVKIIQEFYQSYLLKNYIGRWVVAYGKLKFQRKVRIRRLAVDFYKRRLLEKSFKILWKIRERKRTREEKMDKFREIYSRVYLTFYLNLWSEKRRKKMVCDHLEEKAKQWREDHLMELFLAKLLKKYRERLEEKEEMANVIKYSDAVIVHRAFRGWMKVTDRKVNKRIQSENATKFYLDKLTRKMFDCWRAFKLLKRSKKMAVNYYRNVLLLRVMDGWKIFLSEQRLKLTEAQNLEKRLNARLLRNAFGCWREEMRSLHSKLNVAVDYREKSTLGRAFRTWKENAKMKALCKSRYNRNRIILSGFIIKDAIFRWYEMHSVKLSLKRRLEGFRAKRKIRLMDFHFSTWHAFVQKMKSVRENASIYPQIRSSLLIEEYLVILLDAVKSRKILRRKSELARRAEEKILKRKYLRKWLCFISWKRERILRCVTEERKYGCKAFEFCPPVGTTKRRQPMIPGFLKTDYRVDLFEGCTNQETCRVAYPVNKKLPIIGRKDSFASFDI